MAEYLTVAAKAAVVNSKGEVLVVREARSDPNNKKVGRYGLVGGRLETNESFFDALAREVKEETGLSVKPLKPLLVGEWWPQIDGIKHHIVAVFMLCQPTKSGRVKLSLEHDDFKWINPAKRKEIRMMRPDCWAVDALLKEP